MTIKMCVHNITAIAKLKKKNVKKWINTEGLSLAIKENKCNKANFS